MNYIADILTNKYSDQGIQNLSVFYDSLLFDLKVKDSTSFYNIVLIEKIFFDYDNNKIERTNNGIYVNFGDTGFSQAYKTNGNCFIKAFFEPKTKKVLLAGIRQTNSGNTVPIIYSYDVNNHSCKCIFPFSSVLQEFEDFDNFNFSSDFFPLAFYTNHELSIIFKSSDSNFNYLNSLKIKINSSDSEIKSYDIYKYDKNVNIDFKNLDEKNLFLSFNSYIGVSTKV